MRHVFPAKWGRLYPTYFEGKYDKQNLWQKIGDDYKLSF